jgi:HPt (histidine-containing phosphotransfer) domain-containing protein
MLMDNFFLTLDSDLQKLKDAIDSKNSDGISKAAHYVKGACTNLGMDEASEILQDIESNPENSDLDSSLKKLVQIFEEIKKILSKD